MLNKLLSLSEDARYAAIAEISIPDRHALFNSVPTLTEILNLVDVESHETRVKLRYEHILKHPDTVFWDFAECVNPISKVRKTKVPEYETSRYCKVSTNGDVFVLSRKNNMFIRTVKVNHRYERVKINSNSKPLHRIIASTFISRPEHLKNIPYSSLYVNHKDFTCYNNCIMNLEWVTSEENMRHSRRVERYREEKYFLFECIINNGFLGRSFVLSEYNLHSLSINFATLRGYISVRSANTYRGFHVTMIHREEIGETFVGFPEDIAELLAKEPRYFDNVIKPVIGMVLYGKYKGFTFSLFGVAEINHYFSTPNVSAVALGKVPSHYGCTFRYATHKEAMPLHGKLTKEIAEDAKKSKTYKGIRQ